MNRICLFFVWLGLSLVSHSFGQDGVYHHIGFRDDNQCNLYVEIWNGKYHLYLSYVLSIDNLTGTTISIGKIHEEGTMMMLEDELFGYTMVLERLDPTTLVMKQGFTSMIGVTFDYLCFPTSAPFVYSSDTRDFNRDPHHVKQENCKARRERKVGFQAGDYSLGNEKNYLLKTEENGRFTYFYHGVQISKGKWKRCGNLLALRDDGLNKPFFAIIKEKGIVSSYLPGAFIDSVWEPN